MRKCHQAIVKSCEAQGAELLRPLVNKKSEGENLRLIEFSGSVRISVSGEVIPGAAQRGCPLYLRCSMPDLMR